MIEHIGFAQFVVKDRSAPAGARFVTECKTIGQGWIGEWPPAKPDHLRLAIYCFNRHASSRLIANGRSAIVGNVEIEQAVPVNISEGDGTATAAWIQNLARKRKTTAAIIPEAVGPLSHRIDD